MDRSKYFKTFTASGPSSLARITLGGNVPVTLVKVTSGAVLTYYLNLGFSVTSVTPDNTWYSYDMIGTGWVRNNKLSLFGID